MRTDSLLFDSDSTMGNIMKEEVEKTGISSK